MPNKVLLIDDEEHFLTAMSARLKASGYDVQCAANGIKGLELAAAQVPDAVVCDIAMPGLDGFETLERLRKVPGCMRTPLIFLSANIQPENRTHAHDAGASCFMSKPCESKKLLAALQNAIRDKSTKQPVGESSTPAHA